MKFFARVTIVAMVLAASAFLAGTASATILPSDYRTTAGSGSFNTDSLLGTASCQLSNVAGSATSSSTGVITAFTVPNCDGVIVSAAYNKDIPITVTLGNPSRVDALVAILIVNILGGACLYKGTMSGTPNGTGTVTVQGVVPLFRNLWPSQGSGLCTDEADASVTLTLPGATIH